MLESRNHRQDRQEGTAPVPRLKPLELPAGYFVLQRSPGQYQALHEEEPGLFRAIATVRTRRNLAAQDIYRYVALPPTPPHAPTDDQPGE